MRYKIIISIASVLSLLNGLSFILLPAFSLSLLGRSTNSTGIMNARLFGACALGLALITWLGRNSESKEVRKLVAYGMLVTLALLVLVDISGLVSGAVNSLGWLFFAADFSLSVALLVAIFTGGGV